MEKVRFVFNNGKSAPLKRKMAEHLEYMRKGVIWQEREVVASDAVRAEAADAGIDLHQIDGSGKDGRILRRDIQTYKTRMLTAK
jgi:pyruvate/2-oxoglutarate dehydrogenase complex dihydrolipoamide acyltransferase (E2) component